MFACINRKGFLSLCARELKIPTLVSRLTDDTGRFTNSAICGYRKGLAFL